MCVRVAVKFNMSGDPTHGNGESIKKSGVRRRRFVGTVGAAGITLLAGCSGGDGGGGAVTDSGSGSSDPILIGASASLSGKYSLEGRTMAEGYEAWVNQMNENGGPLNDEPGLLGRQVELTVLDDQSDPSRAVNLYRRLINEENVDLLMGPYSSAVSTSVIPIIEQNQMACVMPMMSDTSVLAERDVSYVTQAIAPADTYVQGAIDIAADNGAETFAVVYEDTAFPTSTAEGHIPYAEDKGLELVHQEAYPKDINDYTPVMNKVQSAEADIVFGGGYTPDAVGLTTAAKSIGYSPGIMAFLVGAVSPGFYESTGADGLAVSGDLFWAPFFDLPHNDAFIEGFMNLHGNNYESPDGIDYHSTGGYAGLMVMAEGVRAVGELDQAAIAEQLHQLEMEIPFANGIYEVNDQGIQTGQAPSLGQWQEAEGGDGLTREAVWPDQYATTDPIYPHPGW